MKSSDLDCCSPLNHPDTSLQMLRTPAASTSRQDFDYVEAELRVYNTVEKEEEDKVAMKGRGPTNGAEQKRIVAMRSVGEYDA